MARRGLTLLVPLALAVAVVASSGATAQSRVPTQSPIDVTADSIRIDPTQPWLHVSYGHSELELEYVRKDESTSDGCAVRHPEETEEANVTPGAGHVTVAGVRYDLIQFHFHTPAEHTVNGRANPLEMHLVHRSAAGRLLVIGVPLHAGRKSTVDSVLATLAPECGETVDLPEIDLNSLLPTSRATLNYQGSLTTYPFSEDVQWFLTRDLTVSQATIDRFKGLFTSGNARSTQPLNGRSVTLTPRI